ncbi:DUF1007 family protein [Amorphus coralli]|uniref:DUF1007 family protein n=1 Tax=Amorphus coralli TaxID=340680 RepID=UPI000370CE9B|nr:DUF1007 family protein [Amorphus coralli]
MNRAVALFGAGIVTLSLFAGEAAAHPHVFVEAKSELVYNEAGELAGVQHAWRFDGPFSAFAVQGLDANGDGDLSHEELAELAQVNVESLDEYSNFTFLNRDGVDLQNPFSEAQDYWLDYSDGRLTLFFALPLAEPIDVSGVPVTVDVYDPEYFVAFEMNQDEPFALLNAPAECDLSVELAGSLDPMTQTQLAAIPSDQRTIPDEYRSATTVLANTALVTCP